MNIGIILAAGTSSRFNQIVQKQLFEIDGKPIVNHSIDTMQFLDDLIIVTNSNCKINTKNKILINDVNCRLESIKVALDYLGDVVVEHMHYLNGKAEQDDRYQEVNSSDVYTRDRATFETYITGEFKDDMHKLMADLGIQ